MRERASLIACTMMAPVPARRSTYARRTAGRPCVKAVSESTMRKREYRLRKADSSVAHAYVVPEPHVPDACTESDDAAPPEQFVHDTDQSVTGHSPGINWREMDRSGAESPPHPGAEDADQSVGQVHPDQSANANISPRTKNACLLASWQANRGKACDAAMQDLVDNVIPHLDTSELPRWRQVPRLIFAADGHKEPQAHEFLVCKACGVTKRWDRCPWCTTRVTDANTWVTQGCAIMDIADIVRSWFRSPEDAAALLAYLRPPSVDSSMPHSIRAAFYYDLLKAMSAEDSVELGIVGVLHFDGFAPFAQRPDDYTVDYLLVRPVLDEFHGCMQRFVRPWVLWDGPSSVKSLEPITHVLKEQVCYL